MFECVCVCVCVRARMRASVRLSGGDSEGFSTRLEIGGMGWRVRKVRAWWVWSGEWGWGRGGVGWVAVHVKETAV